MPLTTDTFNVMEFLWEQLPKHPDPEHLTLSQADLDALWEGGFVNATVYDRAAWRAAFDAHRLPDGRYLLTEADFLAKDRYRYQGEIHVPFDALKINEGYYTDEGLQELIADSIAPSVRAPDNRFAEWIGTLKETTRESNGLLRIDMAAKRRIRDWINRYPSPLRRLELTFDAMIQQQLYNAALTGALPAATTPEQVAHVEASTFTMLPDHPIEAKSRALKALQQALPQASPSQPKNPGTPLKRLTRSRKGARA